MLYSVVLFCTLCVIEVIKCSNEVACDSADTLELDVTLFSAARGTGVSDNAGIAANGVMVNGVVDRAVADAVVVHQAYDFLECVDIFSRITVNLNVGDMTAVCEVMVRTFDSDLISSGDLVIHRNVEGVCIIISVSYVRNLAEFLLVDLDESTGETFCRCCDK